MADAITNTSPLIYLDRIRRLEWLPQLFEEVWVPTAVVDELNEGRQHGHRDLDVDQISGFRVVDPET